MEISKKLFEDITGYLDDTEDISIFGNDIGYFDCYFNIYEFAFVNCKNWLSQKGFNLVVEFDNDSVISMAYNKELTIVKDKQESLQSVINICEKILKGEIK